MPRIIDQFGRKRCQTKHKDAEYKIIRMLCPGRFILVQSVDQSNVFYHIFPLFSSFTNTFIFKGWTGATGLWKFSLRKTKRKKEKALMTDIWWNFRGRVQILFEIGLRILSYMYRNSQKHESTLLHTYVILCILVFRISVQARISVQGGILTEIK